MCFLERILGGLQWTGVDVGAFQRTEGWRQAGMLSNTMHYVAYY